MRANKQTRREAKQLFRLCLVNGLLDENRARQVAQQIVDTKPRGYIATLSQFRRLVESDYAQHTAKVASAMTLPSDLQAARMSRPTSRTGANYFLVDDPALIGGCASKLAAMSMTEACGPGWPLWSKTFELMLNQQ